MPRRTRSGMRAARRSTAPQAAATPKETETATRRAASMTNCRVRRAKDAPSAPRTAISRRRISARTSSRLAMLTQAMSNRTTEPASRIRRMGRISPVMESLKGMTSAPCPWLDCGYCFCSWEAIVLVLASAVETATPSLRRARPENGRHARSVSQTPRSWIVTQSSAARGAN